MHFDSRLGNAQLSLSYFLYPRAQYTRTQRGKSSYPFIHAHRFPHRPYLHSCRGRVRAESGISTFRGVGGLWRNYRTEEVASPEAWHRDPRLVWEFYSLRRRVASAVKPNPAHVALAHLEQNLREALKLPQRSSGWRRIFCSPKSSMTRLCARIQCVQRPTLSARETHKSFAKQGRVSSMARSCGLTSGGTNTETSGGNQIRNQPRGGK
jgi:Sir2 family